MVELLNIGDPDQMLHSAASALDLHCLPITLGVSRLQWVNTTSTLWANSANDKLMIFFLFSQKISFEISCKLSPQEEPIFWEK